ncbi:MAG TPA: hypothetical protein VFV24_11945, partial [Candidatus Eisenbacteria bacterium]|nr:hypothetical protein [Candidatus Eisenbacteria bacterium]
MNRFVLTLSLILALALCVSACARKTEQQVSMTDTLLTENPATMEEGTPPAEPPTSSTSPPTSTTPSTPRTPATPASARTVSLPAGATFDVVMVSGISTETSNVGDKIEGKLKTALTSPDHGGAVIAEQGASIHGEITELRRASRAKSEDERAMVKLQFTTIHTVDGDKPLSSTVTNSEGKMVAGSTTTRDALIIGGSTVAGAVIGKVVGKDTKATVIGAVGGAILGTGAVMAAKGYELEVPAGATVTLRAESPVTV